jgi:hypothetical protein
MKYLFLLILKVSSLTIYGQNHLLGVKGGVSLTNVNSNLNSLSQSEPRTGLIAGLTYEYLFKNHISVGAELIYNQRGFINYIVLPDQFVNPTGERYARRYNYNYISLPVTTGFNIGSKFYGFTNIGITPSFLVNAKSIIPRFDFDNYPEIIMTGNKTSDIANSTKSLDLAGFAEFGGGYKFKNGFWLFTSFAYQHSITRISSSEHSNSKTRHNGMMFTIGVKSVLTTK